MSKYTVVITDRDPTQADAQTHISFPPCTRKLDAYSDCRHYAKVYRGFGTVYEDDGESLFEIDFTYRDTDEEE